MLGICVGVHFVYVLGNNVTYMLGICVGVYYAYVLGKNEYVGQQPMNVVTQHIYQGTQHICIQHISTWYICWIPLSYLLGNNMIYICWVYMLGNIKLMFPNIYIKGTQHISGFNFYFKFLLTHPLGLNYLNFCKHNFESFWLRMSLMLCNA